MPTQGACRVPRKLDQFRNNTVLALATGLGSGYSPVAPGTAGSVVGLAAAWFASRLGDAPYIGVCAAVFVLGTWAAGAAERIYGEKDSGRITIDEVLGMMLTVWLLPATPLVYIVGFLLFRVFDILKPFPAGHIDKRVNGGAGVMLDDVVAGIYSNICLHGLLAALS